MLPANPWPPTPSGSRTWPPACSSWGLHRAGTPPSPAPAAWGSSEPRASTCPSGPRKPSPRCTRVCKHSGERCVCVQMRVGWEAVQMWKPCHQAGRPRGGRGGEWRLYEAERVLWLNAFWK